MRTPDETRECVAEKNVFGFSLDDGCRGSEFHGLIDFSCHHSKRGCAHHVPIYADEPTSKTRQCVASRNVPIEEPQSSGQAAESEEIHSFSKDDCVYDRDSWTRCATHGGHIINCANALRGSLKSVGAELKKEKLESFRAWGRVNSLSATNAMMGGRIDSLEERLSKQTAYSITLQRMIEALAAGRPIPDSDTYLRSVALRVQGRIETLTRELADARAKRTHAESRAKQLTAGYDSLRIGYRTEADHADILWSALVRLRDSYPHESGTVASFMHEVASSALAAIGGPSSSKHDDEPWPREPKNVAANATLRAQHLPRSGSKCFTPVGGSPGWCVTHGSNMPNGKACMAAQAFGHMGWSCADPSLAELTCPYPGCGHAYAFHADDNCSACECPEWIGYAWCRSLFNSPHCVNFGPIERCDAVNAPDHAHHASHATSVSAFESAKPFSPEEARECARANATAAAKLRSAPDDERTSYTERMADEHARVAQTMRMYADCSENTDPIAMAAHRRLSEWVRAIGVVVVAAQESSPTVDPYMAALRAANEAELAFMAAIRDVRDEALRR